MIYTEVCDGLLKEVEKRSKARWADGDALTIGKGRIRYVFISDMGLLFCNIEDEIQIEDKRVTHEEFVRECARLRPLDKDDGRT